MRDLILNLMLGFAAGGFMGWQLRGLLAERELYRAEEEAERVADGRAPDDGDRESW